MGKNRRGGRGGHSSSGKGLASKRDRQATYDSKLKQRSNAREEELCEGDQTNEGKIVTAKVTSQLIFSGFTSFSHKKGFQTLSQRWRHDTLVIKVSRKGLQLSLEGGYSSLSHSQSHSYSPSSREEA